jgi:hypothetical protein
MGAAFSIDGKHAVGAAINPIRAQPEVRLLTEEEQKKVVDMQIAEQKRRAELQKKLGM